MNIFVLDVIPDKAAEYHIDKHVVKMPLETAQMLSAVHWRYGNEGPYELSHANHPCTVWAGQSVENYRWLWKLGKALCKEYTHRYDKTHACERIIQMMMMPPLGLTARGFTPFALAMPEQYKGHSAVESYRQYYLNEKVKIASWTRRSSPFFIPAELLLTLPSTSED